MTSCEYSCDGNGFTVTDEMKADFDKHGYIMVRKLFDKKEMDRIENALSQDVFTKHNCAVNDGKGKMAQMCIWNLPGNDLTGMVGRCEKIVTSCEKLLGGDVYHYHSKLMKKPAKIGGPHLWHQDYGYWYMNGCLFPDMMTVFIAVDKCKKSNGCLQVLDGSNLCGRVDHVRMGGQIGADLERVEEIKKKLELKYCEMETGDALFMHCNVLHCSSVNESEDKRWALLCCYNKATNNPVREHHHPLYSPIHKVPDEAIMTCEAPVVPEEKDFLMPGRDKTSLLNKVEKDN